MQVNGVLESSLYADDLEAAEEFYVNVLNLEVHSARADRHVFFRCGPGMLLIFNPLVSSLPHEDEIPSHGSEGPGHLAFSIDADSLEQWREQLRSRGVPIEKEIDWPTGHRSIYFRDPAGNSLELAVAGMWK